MLQKITKWLKPPIFLEDDDKTRIAALLHPSLLIVTLAMPILIAGSILGENTRIGGILVFTISFIFMLGLQILVRKGHVKLTATLLVIFVTISNTAYMTISGTVRHTAGGVFFALTSVMAGLLISRRAALITVAINCSIYLVLLIAQINGLLPPPIYAVSISQAITFTVAAVWTVTLLNQATRGIDKSLALARNELTERQRAEARLRALVENSPDFILEVNRQGEILFINRRPDLIIGRNVRDFLLPEAITLVIKMMEKAFTDGKPQAFELQTIDPAGEPTWDSVRLGPVKDGNLVTSLTVSLTDIRIQKQTEAQREKLLKEIETQNAELERFNYTISHELKSPVVTIKGFLGLLKKDLEENRQDKVQKDFERIAEAAEKMGTLLSELLELSRVGRIVNPPEEIDLVKLTQAVLESLDHLLQSYNIKVEVSPVLPVVYADRNRLREVLENLIDNAAKYMGDQPNPLIKIDKRESGTETIIYVQDNGMGVEPQFHTKIFGLFEKLNTDSEGTGIGLALIKRIIEVHGGRIWIESEGLGKGSTFCFTIPGKKTGS